MWFFLIAGDPLRAKVQAKRTRDPQGARAPQFLLLPGQSPRARRGPVAEPRGLTPPGPREPGGCLGLRQRLPRRAPRLRRPFPSPSLRRAPPAVPLPPGRPSRGRTPLPPRAVPPAPLTPRAAPPARPGSPPAPRGPFPAAAGPAPSPRALPTWPPSLPASLALRGAGLAVTERRRRREAGRGRGRRQAGRRAAPQEGRHELGGVDVGHEGLGVDVQLPAEGRPEQLLLRLGLRGRRGAARAGAAARLDVRLVPAVGSRVATAPAAAPVRLHFVAAPQGSAAPKRLPGEGGAGGGTDSALAPPIPRVLRRPDASAVWPLGPPYPLPAASPTAIVVVFISPGPPPAARPRRGARTTIPVIPGGRTRGPPPKDRREMELPASLARSGTATPGGPRERRAFLPAPPPPPGGRGTRSWPERLRRDGTRPGQVPAVQNHTELLRESRGDRDRTEAGRDPPGSAPSCAKSHRTCPGEVQRDRGSSGSTHPPAGCRRERCPTCPAKNGQDTCKVPILGILQHTLTWLLPGKKPHSVKSESKY